MSNLNISITTSAKSEIERTFSPLPALENLINNLNQAEIRYCHWKSNIRLPKSLVGETDLDLLVDRRQSAELRSILAKHNVKPLAAAPGRRYPAMEHYLGFDETTGRLFHFHVHYQLVLGEQFIKNYRLPLEEQFIQSAQLCDKVKIPSPELELIVLAIRVLLKYRDRDVVKDIIPYRSPGLSPEFRKEIKWLLAKTTIERVSQTLQEISDVLPSDVVLDFLKVVISGNRPWLKLYQLRSRVRRNLSLFQRNGIFSATAEYFRESWNRRKIFRSEPISKMTLPEGGLTLAMIGADGSGKSTLTAMLVKWLSWKLDVHAYYLGLSKTSRLADLYYLIFKMFRRGNQEVSRLLGSRGFPARFLALLRDLFISLYHISNARERYKYYLWGRKRAMAGSIVIFERYPLATFQDNAVRQMDGPAIPYVVQEPWGRLIGSLIEKERRFYAEIHQPDSILILDIDPDIARRRKPDHKADVVETKSLAVKELIRTMKGDQSANLISINANRPYEEVVNQLKKEIWKLL